MLALITDLIFATKVTSTARSVDRTVKVVRNLDALAARLNAAGDSVALLDLNCDGVDVLEAIRMCRAAPHRPRIVCYASHVQAELIRAAREAGADEVMARSAFVAKLPALLAMGAPSTPAPNLEAQS